MKVVGSLTCARCHIHYIGMVIDNLFDHTGWVCDNCKAEQQGLSVGNANTVNTGVLSEETLFELGFKRESDGMYREGGWINEDIDIMFKEKKITKEKFWKHIMKVVEVRGEINFKNKLKELLK